MIKSRPFVSIIIPNYNHANFLEQRLYSVYNQSYKDFEVILLDDNSTDDSIDILQRFAIHPKTSHFLINNVNSGSPFKQWKKGLDHAIGEYIWIAESDDYCELNFLERIFEYRSKIVDDIGLIYSQTIDVSENGQVKKSRVEVTNRFEKNIWVDNFTLSGEVFVKEYLKNHNVIPNASAVVFKKELLDSEFFENEILEMTMCGDWLLWINFCSRTSVGFVSDELNYFRIHKDVSRNQSNIQSKIKRLLEEARIRKVLSNKFDVNQKEEIKNLYTQWFSLFNLRQVFDSSFYRVLVPETSYIKFIIRFLFKNKHVK